MKIPPPIDAPDALESALRAQARGFNPQPPPALRRRIFSALAEAPSPAAESPAPHWPRLGWSLAAVVLVVGLLAVVATLIPRPARDLIAKDPSSTPATRALPQNALAIADPLALAHKYLDQPLESEVHTLLTHLTHARDTVARVLPAPRKHAPEPPRTPTRAAPDESRVTRHPAERGARATTGNAPSPERGSHE